MNKPAGLVVHPGAGHATGTLVHALLHHVKDLSGIGGEARPGIVHRLDKGTSGVMVVAKHDAAHQELARQFHDREVEKEYVALVWGVVHNRKRIDLPIGRDPVHREKISTRARRAARTPSRASRGRATLPGVTLIRVAIATGRTHQIRVHLSAIGHAIVGDCALRRRAQARGRTTSRAVQRLTRPFLHAERLAFTHPAHEASACRSRRRCPTTCSSCSTTSRRPTSCRAALVVREPCPMTDPTTPSHERREVYRGRVFSLSVDRVTLPSGHTVDMDVVRHPGSVVLLPMPAPDQLILIRQYRYAVDRFIWELPAGSLEAGRGSEPAARPRVRRGDRPRAGPPRAARRALPDARASATS